MKIIKSLIDHIKRGYESKHTLITIHYVYLDGEPMDSTWLSSNTVIITLHDLNGSLTEYNVKRYITHNCYTGLGIREFRYSVKKEKGKR